MLTVRNLRPKPTKLDWLRANASSIAALFLWACAMVVLAEVGRPDEEQVYGVTFAEGAMFFSRNSGAPSCEAAPSKPDRAIDRIDCGEEPPTYERN